MCNLTRYLFDILKDSHLRILAFTYLSQEGLGVSIGRVCIPKKIFSKKSELTIPSEHSNLFIIKQDGYGIQKTI